MLDFLEWPRCCLEWTCSGYANEACSIDGVSYEVKYGCFVSKSNFIFKAPLLRMSEVFKKEVAYSVSHVKWALARLALARKVVLRSRVFRDQVRLLQPPSASIPVQHSNSILANLIETHRWRD
jgi:hypothetical protein